MIIPIFCYEKANLGEFSFLHSHKNSCSRHHKNLQDSWLACEMVFSPEKRAIDCYHLSWIKNIISCLSLKICWPDFHYVIIVTPRPWICFPMDICTMKMHRLKLTTHKLLRDKPKRRWFNTLVHWYYSLRSFLARYFSVFARMSYLIASKSTYHFRRINLNNNTPTIRFNKRMEKKSKTRSKSFYK